MICNNIGGTPIFGNLHMLVVVFALFSGFQHVMNMC